ncbi:MAG: hypothetical protein JWP74_3451 [Marmoricola sp.]|nr:hypothetical protein [Marmoricola sp.]
MSESPQLGELLESYGGLAQQLLTRWTPFLTAASDKVATGTYGKDDAAEDFSAMAKLVLDTAVLTGYTALGGMAILTTDSSTEQTTGEFSTDPKLAGTPRVLTLQGDLKSATGKVLPVDRVTPQPATLPPRSTQFDLHVDGSDVAAAIYRGTALSTDATGAVEEVAVSVSLP